MVSEPFGSPFFKDRPEDLARVAALLLEGQLVAVPTETVYGLAANALDARACEQIFEVKQRPRGNPLICHLHRIEQVQYYCKLKAGDLDWARSFWPGPLSLILKKKNLIPDGVTAGQDSVAIRIPGHPLFRKLLEAVDVPLAAPSANPFGYVSPTQAQHVRDSFSSEKLPYILDGGPCIHGIESTILDFRNPSKPSLLRSGPISKNDLEKVLKIPVHEGIKQLNSFEQATSPGLFKSHYSPHTPLSILTELDPSQFQPKSAYLYTYKPESVPDLPAGSAVFWLCEASEGLEVAAQRLYARLREVDLKGFDRLYVEAFPGTQPLSIALNDRIQRAAAS